MKQPELIELKQKTPSLCSNGINLLSCYLRVGFQLLESDQRSQQAPSFHGGVICGNYKAYMLIIRLIR